MNNKKPSVCIIDDSAMTTKLYRYLIEQFLEEPKVSTFTHPWDVNVLKLDGCGLLIIDEVMDDMSGTEFLEQVLTEHFAGHYHDFPNVIFASSLEPGDLIERIKARRLDTMLPAFRVLQKPLTPTMLRTTMLSLCKNLERYLQPNIEIPNSELPWHVSIKKAVDEILGLKDSKPTKHCMIAF